MTTKPYLAREIWLARAISKIAARVFKPAGLELPPVKVSCSWPGGGSARKRSGECWPKSSSAARINEIFISPILADHASVLGLLVHELVHAHDDCESGHRGAFKRSSRLVGLEGPPSRNAPGAELARTLATVAEELGPYPHAALNLAGRKKQTTRLIKAECSACGCAIRITQKWIDEAHDGLSCPVCRGEMHHDGAEDNEE